MAKFGPRGMIGTNYIEDLILAIATAVGLVVSEKQIFWITIKTYLLPVPDRSEKKKKKKKKKIAAILAV